jgi:hypothetical protein
MNSANLDKTKSDEENSQKPFVAPQLMKSCLNLFS